MSGQTLMVKSYISSMHQTWLIFCQGLSNTHPNSSLMSFYSPILRHYALNWEHGVRSWEGPAYTLSKVGSYPLDWIISYMYKLRRVLLSHVLDAQKSSIMQLPIPYSSCQRMCPKLKTSRLFGSGLQNLCEWFSTPFSFKRHFILRRMSKTLWVYAFFDCSFFSIQLY